MTAPAEVQSSLELGELSTMTFAEAALRLTTSQAELCRLILAGDLRQAGRRRVERAGVEALAHQQKPHKDRMRRAPGRLSRSAESGLWLLSDWGGSARTTDLGAGMEVSWQNADGRMQTALKFGYVIRADRTYTLTEEGWEYVRKYRNPL